MAIVAIAFMVDHAKDDSQMQQEGRQKELACHLRIGDAPRTAGRTVNRHLQSVRRGLRQEVIRGFEIILPDLHPEVTRGGRKNKKYRKSLSL